MPEIRCFLIMRVLKAIGSVLGLAAGRDLSGGHNLRPQHLKTSVACAQSSARKTGIREGFALQASAKPTVDSVRRAKALRRTLRSLDFLLCEIQMTWRHAN